MVIHDLAFEHFPDHVPALTAKYYRRFTPRYAEKVNRIATVSEFTKQDVIRLYHQPPEKIDVTWNGSNEMFHPLTGEEREKSKKDFARGNEYFVYAGAIQPRKNIINLFLAFDQFKSETSSSIKLVIAGRNWKYSEAMKTHSRMRFKDEVIFAGHLSRIDLSRLLGGAFALVYVSFFEGFGIPIVESMNCDVPVITSNVSSMPEVAGNAALYVNPNSVDEIADKMKLISESESLRAQLISNGRIQRQKFSWQQTADNLWACMMKAVEK